MDVLNPALFAAMKRVLGQVKVANRGVKAKWHIIKDPKTQKPVAKFEQGGEQYVANCPFCNDFDFRLNVGHMYLRIPRKGMERIAHNLDCYHRHCHEVHGTEFQKRLIDAGADPDSDTANAFVAAFRSATQPAPEPVHEQITLPVGLIPLHELPADHRACQFLVRKYNGITAEVLGLYYGAAYAPEADSRYPAAKDRIIFPVYDKGVLVGWQGRAVGDHPKRWYFPPGCQKVLYNGDNVSHLSVPIICEGITTSIATGRNALAIFGKTMSPRLIEELVAKWPTAVVLLDADAHIPNPMSHRVAATELADNLSEAFVKAGKSPVYLFRWDEQLLALARRKVGTLQVIDGKRVVVPDKTVSVPDAADFGPALMRYLLDQQVPGTHRGFV